MALAVFFRFWDIKTIPPGLYPDEAMNGNNALEALETKNFKIFYPENNGREGLFINIQAISLAIFGNEPWVLRLVSAIFGTLTVLGLYFLTKVLFKSERIALLASFFLATSFWHINFSRIGFRAIMAPFFLVWSFYFLWQVITKKFYFSSPAFILNNNKVPTASPIEKKSNFLMLALAAIGGLLFGLGFHSYIAYRVAPLLLIIPFILLWRAGQKKLILIFLLFVFLAGLPLGLYFLKNPHDFFGRTSQISIFSGASPLKEFGINIAKTIGMFFWRGDYNWRHNFAGAPALWWPIAILFLAGIWRIIRRREFLFLFSWLAIMLLPTVISSEDLPHALRAIVVIPPVMIFAALGLDWVIARINGWLQEKKNKFPQHLGQLTRIKKEFTVFLFLFLLAIASYAFNQYFLRWTANPNVAGAFSAKYAELGKHLNMLPKDIPKYVIVNADGVDVRGVPMPTQTVMFITKTYLPKWQTEKNIFYITMKNIDSFIKEAELENHLYITTLENDASFLSELKEKIPDLKLDINLNAITLYR